MRGVLKKEDEQRDEEENERPSDFTDEKSASSALQSLKPVCQNVQDEKIAYKHMHSENMQSLIFEEMKEEPLRRQFLNSAHLILASAKSAEERSHPSKTVSLIIAPENMEEEKSTE